VGTGVTAALIAAAVAAFVSVAAFVAFEGMPFSSGGTPENTVAVSGAPNSAALAAGSATDAVAAEPATPSAAATAEIVAALPPGAASDGPASGSGIGGISGDETPATGGTDTGTGEPPVGTPEAPGPLGSVVQGADDTAGGLGLDLPLDETTGGITDTVDGVLGGVLDDKVNDVLGGVLGGN